MVVKNGTEQTFAGIYIIMLYNSEVEFCMKGHTKDTIDDFLEEISTPRISPAEDDVFILS